MAKQIQIAPVVLSFVLKLLCMGCLIEARTHAIPESAKLLARDTSPYDWFGRAISISGDVAVIGADGNNDSSSAVSGSVFVYRWNGSTWIQEQKLLAPPHVTACNFGSAVSVSGDTLVVGTWACGNSADLFRWNGSDWLFEQQLVPLGGIVHPGFGHSVSISGDVAVVGAFGGSGATHVFRWNGVSWVHEQTLYASDAAAHDGFGYSVSVFGDTILIGTSGDDDNGSNAGSAYVFIWNGTTWTEQQKLLPLDGDAGDVFGLSVSLGSDVGVIGAYLDDQSGTDAGAAYMFRRTGQTWIQEQKLTASDGKSNDGFGNAVAYFGDAVVVGANGDDNENGTNAGSAYVFRWNGTTWVQESRLLSRKGSAGDAFGLGVAASDGLIIAGSLLDDLNGQRSGSAQAFRWNGTSWVEEHLLQGLGGAGNDMFGFSTALFGDLAVVGVPNDDDKGLDSGSVLVYRWNGSHWFQEQKLTAADGEIGDSFGTSVAVSDDTVLVGAVGGDDAGSDSGSAYVFRWDGTTWNQNQKLLPPSGSSGDQFGSAVSLSADYIIVGAKLDDHNGVNRGSAYSFRWNGASWGQRQKLISNDGAAQDEFGSSVFLVENRVIIGSPGDDDAGMDSGAAYIFGLNGTTWTQLSKLRPLDGTAGARFGMAAGLTSDLAVIGAHGDMVNGVPAGSAYIFRSLQDTWVQEQKLTASNGAADDAFGHSVAVDGNVAVVGVKGDDQMGGEAGAVYLFRWNGSSWSLDGKLLATDGKPGDELGYSVSLSGNRALTGAIGEDASGSACGSAYIFEFAWCGDGLLDGSEECDDGNVSMLDGCTGTCLIEPGFTCGGAAISVCSDEDECGQGIHDCDANEICSNNLGGFSCACNDGFQACGVQKLLAPDASVGDEFGIAIAIETDVAAIGAWRDKSDSSYSGSVYIFRWDGLAWNQESKISPPDGSDDDRFGISLSMLGDRILVGAPNDDDMGIDSGAAYLFRWNGLTWVHEQKIVAVDGSDGDQFGHSVSLADGVAVVGAHLDEDSSMQSGSTYVFRWDGVHWHQEEKLVPADASAGSRFGCSVSISENAIIVGADGDGALGPYAGAAYVFQWNGTAWAQQQKLLASDGSSENKFGNSVSIADDVAIVGSFLDDTNGLQAGAAYVFRWNGTTWHQEQKLLPSNGASNDRFGASVAIVDDMVAVGAYFDDDSGTDSGSAYVFRWTGSSWIQEQKLFPPNGSAYERFGTSIAVTQGLIVTGAPGDWDNGDNAGTAYAFQYSGNDWLQDPKMRVADEAVGDFFGYSVSASDSVVVVGEHFDSTNGPFAGAAYVYRRNPSTFGLEQMLLASDGSNENQFGSSVSVWGDLILVGARGDDDNGLHAGSAYLFRWNGSQWIEEQKLVALDGAANDFFGQAVSTDDDVALVGAHQDDDSGLNSGSAYVFRWDGLSWIQEQKLVPPPNSPGIQFGYSLSVSGDVVVVGALRDDENGADSGSVYVYRWNGAVWALERRLNPSDAAPNSLFGAAVDLSGYRLIVGAPFDRETATYAGAGYIFEWNGIDWAETQKLLASNGTVHDHLGFAVSIADTVALIGASNHVTANIASGAAYLFRNNGALWTEDRMILPPDGAAQDAFGNTVAVTENLAAIGALRHDENGSESGAAYIYDLACIMPTTCTDIDECALNMGICDSNATCTNSVGAFACTCNSGYSGDGMTCHDDDECALGTHGCDANATCTNVAGTYSCTCNHCYSGDGNTCLLNDLDQDGICDLSDECAGGAASGDTDANGDVDLRDFVDFSICLDGPAVSNSALGCECFDFDSDNHVDLRDFANIQSEFLSQ